MDREAFKERKFGRLTPIEYLGGGKWTCLCDCGETTIVRTGDLNRESTRSCGCLAKEDRFIDLSGKRYNMLSVIKFVYRKGVKNRPYFLCECDCGNFTEVRGSHIKSGKVKSCGCAREIIKGNTYFINGDSGTIKIKNEEILFDVSDLEIINKYTWHITKTGYAASTSEPGVRHMHRLIVQDEIYDDTLVVDHINHNPLDNRKCNLRICTQSENIFYRKPSRRNTSGVVGVHYNKKSKKWSAAIMHQRTQIHLGYYKNIEDAAEARAIAEEQLFHGFTQKDLANNVN